MSGFPNNLAPNLTSGARIIKLGQDGWRLEIPPGSPDRYRLAQLDDYGYVRRSKFKIQKKMKLELTARASNKKLPGTWGFGIWNDPLSMGILSSLRGFRWPAMPQAAWFFYAGPGSYLSLRNDLPAEGWIASTFNSTRRSLLSLSMRLPLLPLIFIPSVNKKLRNYLSSIILQDAETIPVKVTEWNRYALVWEPERSIFKVNGEKVLDTKTSPNAPLGIVIWIDNQYAAWTPEGRIRYGMSGSSHPSWIELKNLLVEY